MKDLFPRALTACALIGFGYLAFYFLPTAYFVALLFLVLVYMVCFEWPRFNVWWLTPWYPVLPFLGCIDLYMCDPQFWAWLVCVVAAYDTGGYLCGNLFGIHKIAPHVSAGKTVEGLMGGIVFAVLIGYIAAFFLLKDHNYGIFFVCFSSIFVAMSAFLGDLFESYLKRLSGLKDAGTILPGHGGVLDRIDGLICAAFVFDLVLIFLR